MKVSERASASCKTFCMNLAAPFISQFFRDRLLAAFPRIDILFGNETVSIRHSHFSMVRDDFVLFHSVLRTHFVDQEYAAFAKEEGLDSSDFVELGKKISAYPKHNECKKRLVIITQGEKPVICVQGDEVNVYEVPQLKPEEIVDTNGAGDAFVGGTTMFDHVATKSPIMQLLYFGFPIDRI
jgi:adenosine kinase